MHEDIPPFLQYVFISWCLVKHREIFQPNLGALSRFEARNFLTEVEAFTNLFGTSGSGGGGARNCLFLGYNLRIISTLRHRSDNRVSTP
jgi:hypothetical protein